MILPESGRVVIIDDKFGEVLPLIRILSRERVAVTYFSGKEKELPDEPFTDVRIVFLDIVLEGVDLLDDKTIISTLTNVVGRIVSKENGPFVLAVWAKKSDSESNIVKRIKEALREKGFYTIDVDLEKTSFFKREKDDTYTFREDKIRDLNKKLQEKLGEVDILKVFIQWENIVNEAASETVNEVSKFSKYDENWNNEMKKIFYHLAKAWLGKLIEETEDGENIRGSFYTFHLIFGDILEKKLQLKEITKIEFEKRDLEDRIGSKINTHILLDMSQRSDIYPGNVYKTETEIKQLIYDSIDRDALISDFARSIRRNKTDLLNKKGILKKIYRKNFNSFFKKVRERLKKVAIPVIVEVSPVCDHVQKKLKKYKYVDGFLCPAIAKIDNIQIRMNEKLNQHALFLYTTPIIRYKERQYILILDFRYFSSADKEFFSDKELLFRIRRELLSDIQIKLSSHINRTGVLYLD